MTHIRLSSPFAKQLIKFLAASLCVSGLIYSNTAFAISFMPSGTTDAASMLINLSKELPNVMRLVTAFAYVMGFFFIVKGIIELKHFGESRSMMSQEHSLGKPLIFLAVGALLIYLPGSVQVGLTTFWTSPNPYGYLASDTKDNWTDLTDSVFVVIQLVGTISFIRGLVILTHVSGHGQPGTFAKAMAHIIAGVLCINLYQFLQAIFTTLGIGTMSP